MYFEMSKKFGDYSFHIVHHTGGVTKRKYELPENFPQPTKTLDDYGTKKYLKSARSTRLKFEFIRKILKFCRILIDNNSGIKMYFLTKEIRGHYSHRLISKTSSKYIFDRLVSHIEDIKLYQNKFAKKLIIHYRLGDLFEESIEKQPTSMQDIVKLLTNFEPKEISEAIVLSDSLKKTEVLFKNQGFQKNNFLNVSPIETIIIGLNSKVFVGTTSKLTIWIAIFRYYFGAKPTFLPNVLKEVISRNLPNLRNINFY
jgi:hypothetical protein